MKEIPGTALSVHLIRADGADGPVRSVAELGFKAFNLARLARLGVPVPAAFVLGTDWCAAVHAHGGDLPGAARELIQGALRTLEAATGLGFGHARRPLLVSVRSGAPVSMPGMLETVLDVGLCDATVSGLLRLTGNPRLVWDSYRRFIESYGEIVAGIPSELFAAASQQRITQDGVEDLAELDFRSLRALTRQYLTTFEQVAGQPFPQSPLEQLERSIGAVFRSWDADKARFYRSAHSIDSTIGTAVTVQRMVFGNAGGTSGAGVGFTRDPSSGAPGLYFDYVPNAQGEDVVSGRTRVPVGRMASLLPETSREELVQFSNLLEREFRDVQEFEFTIENGQLFVLQTRAAKRTPLATLRTAVEFAEAGLIDGAEARRRVAGLAPAALETTEFERPELATPIAVGVAAGIGVASGVAVCEPSRAIERARRGEAVILVREDVATTDIAAVEAAAGLLAVRGARTSHAAVVARQLGKACIVGCGAVVLDDERRGFVASGQRIVEGDWLTLDSTNGRVYAGNLPVVRRRPVELLERLAHLA